MSQTTDSNDAELREHFILLTKNLKLFKKSLKTWPSPLKYLGNANSNVICK